VEPVGFDRFLKILFAQKRKTLQNNLRAGGFAPDRIAATWPASIPPQARAESVALEPLAEFYRTLADETPTAAPIPASTEAQAEG
jgi:16S rRNA (adenine1518-N6/adenine1519-N6)-dimethyltransferase